MDDAGNVEDTTMVEEEDEDDDDTDDDDETYFKKQLRRQGQWTDEQMTHALRLCNNVFQRAVDFLRNEAEKEAERKEREGLGLTASSTGPTVENPESFASFLQAAEEPTEYRHRFCDSCSHYS